MVSGVLSIAVRRLSIISTLAEAIGHSHASVSKIVKEMTRAGITQSEKVAGDARINQVGLTAAGRQLVPKFNIQAQDVEAVVEELLAQSQHNLWEAVSEMEFLLSEENLYARIRQKYLLRERRKIALVEYDPSFADAFKALNYEWIERFFEMEESDRVMLDAPQEVIVDNGGYIVIALYEGQTVGSCALLSHGDRRYELAKMAVAEHAKGKHIGYLMGLNVIEKARQSGAKSIFLESNTRLVPALKLYQKLGFQRIVGAPSPYARCNIQMQMQL